MKVLVVGSGGREHALCWAIANSPLLTKLYCAPGNPGIATVAECVNIDALEIPALVGFAQDNAIDLVVPGPEAPLVAGLTDAMEAAGIACCGPTKAAAQLEGSKTFTKEIADAASIPTALWERFEDADAARAFVRKRGAPIVVKADGLAGGKGVIVATTVDEAARRDRRHHGPENLRRSRRRRRDRGMSDGEEVSLFALCDGEDALLLGSAQDHKRVGDGDTGPNTGGMGAYAPVRNFPPKLEQACLEMIIRPALREMASAAHPISRHPVCRPDADRGRCEADRIQRPVRRPGVPGAPRPLEVRPAARPAGRLRRRIARLRPAPAATRPRSPW